MLKILFYTFPEGHLVSDKEFARLFKGFAKEGMELIRWNKDKGENVPQHDVVMVKGFSHSYAEIIKYKPVVYLSIGTEWKKGIDIAEANEPIRELYEKANATIHISRYCAQLHDQVFRIPKHSYVIIPAEEAKLPKEYPELTERLRLATTCIPRPVKRVEELERLCKRFDIELVPAYGNVDNFDYYYNCHGYIHLSRKEGMPNTVLEALSYGLPCITTNHGGAKEVAQIIIKNDSPDTMWDMSNVEPVDDFLFEAAIKDLKENLHKHRMNVRERVLTELNDKVAAQKFKAVFESLL